MEMEIIIRIVPSRLPKTNKLKQLLLRHQLTHQYPKLTQTRFGSTTCTTNCAKRIKASSLEQLIHQESEAVIRPPNRNSSAPPPTIIIKLTHPPLTSLTTTASPQTSQEATWIRTTNTPKVGNNLTATTNLEDTNRRINIITTKIVTITGILIMGKIISLTDILKTTSQTAEVTLLCGDTNKRGSRWWTMGVDPRTEWWTKLMIKLIMTTTTTSQQFITPWANLINSETILRITDTCRMEKVSRGNITAKISNMAIRGATINSTETELRASTQTTTRSSQRRRLRILKRGATPSSSLKAFLMRKRARSLNTRKLRLNRVLYKQIKNYRKQESIRWPHRIFRKWFHRWTSTSWIWTFWACSSRVSTRLTVFSATYCIWLRSLTTNQNCKQ